MLNLFFHLTRDFMYSKDWQNNMKIGKNFVYSVHILSLITRGQIFSIKLKGYGENFLGRINFFRQHPQKL